MCQASAFCACGATWASAAGAARTLAELAQAGLRIEFLHEHAATFFQRYPMLERSRNGEYRFPAGHPRIPLMYSIRAIKSA